MELVLEYLVSVYGILGLIISIKGKWEGKGREKEKKGNIIRENVVCNGCSFSYIGIWGRRIVLVYEFEIRLNNKSNSLFIFNKIN